MKTHNILKTIVEKFDYIILFILCILMVADTITFEQAIVLLLWYWMGRIHETLVRYYKYQK